MSEVGNHELPPLRPYVLRDRGPFWDPKKMPFAGIIFFGIFFIVGIGLLSNGINPWILGMVVSGGILTGLGTLGLLASIIGCFLV
jgi:hypothetical protein